MDDAERRLAAHLNLVDSSRQLFELDSGVRFAEFDGALIGAGSHPHPAITNAVMRRDDAVEAGDLITEASRFFGDLERGFSVYVRGGYDDDLVAAAEEHGLNFVYEMPEMVREQPVEHHSLPESAEVRRVTDTDQVGAYWELTAKAYVSVSFPPEVFGHYDRREGLLADNVDAFLGYLDGKPVSAAMTVVHDGVAGIYWVGTLEEARGRGLAWATTAAATNAGFDRGAELASLQASHMGEPIYARMGYETLYPYRLFMAPPPSR
ncbi:MAG: GNAT family N-acetyltransferase [Solirubrobacterales bacterium]